MGCVEARTRAHLSRQDLYSSRAAAFVCHAAAGPCNPGFTRLTFVSLTVHHVMYNRSVYEAFTYVSITTQSITTRTTTIQVHAPASQ